MTKTPEEWLEEVSPKERTEGILKLFLGYAPEWARRSAC